MGETVLGGKKNRAEKKCQKSVLCLASEFPHIIHGDPLQSANTFPVMTLKTAHSNSLLYRWRWDSGGQAALLHAVMDPLHAGPGASDAPKPDNGSRENLGDLASSLGPILSSVPTVLEIRGGRDFSIQFLHCNKEETEVQEKEALCLRSLVHGRMGSKAEQRT